MINENNSNSNWKKLLGLRNMQEKLEKKRVHLGTWKNHVELYSVGLSAL